MLSEYVVKIVSGGGGVFKTDKRIFHKFMQGYLLVFKIGKPFPAATIS